jgi:hypothetical protein
MRRYEVTQNAKDVAERGIRPSWLEQVLESPELVELDRDDPELTHHGVCSKNRKAPQLLEKPRAWLTPAKNELNPLCSYRCGVGVTAVCL